LPSPIEGRINVRELMIVLGLKRSQVQRFFNHAELRTPISAAAEVQSLAPIGPAFRGMMRMPPFESISHASLVIALT